MSFLIGNDPSPRSYNDSAHHHCHNHYHHHHHNHLHQQSSSIIIIFYLSWLQQGSSTISCPKLSQGPAAWGLSAKDYAPNILQRLCTKYFFKESAQNILQRLGTKYFAKNLHQIVCNSYNCWEKKDYATNVTPKIIHDHQIFRPFFQQPLCQKLYMLTMEYYASVTFCKQGWKWCFVYREGIPKKWIFFMEFAMKEAGSRVPLRFFKKNCFKTI